MDDSGNLASPSASKYFLACAKLNPESLLRKNCLVQQRIAQTRSSTARTFLYGNVPFNPLQLMFAPLSCRANSCCTNCISISAHPSPFFPYPPPSRSHLLSRAHRPPDKIHNGCQTLCAGSVTVARDTPRLRSRVSSTVRRYVESLVRACAWLHSPHLHCRAHRPRDKIHNGCQTLCAGSVTAARDTPRFRPRVSSAVRRYVESQERAGVTYSTSPV
ncbi:hypothetical protein SISSUDRAFT_543647 [Sistotremastrum suecicum HHB10207 ss-3]|uniref:Uncharacterized protein n=1 Tax=Sistotremastrum suecicum HHB10207 ss-3 TaxID=1314776 RepID=A0A165XNV9_9AGAM|nr:hypothetical protein SISSUDRAFT_543647 [Sistotremastrum suecicum HHB10207 ss-3]